MKNLSWQLISIVVVLIAACIYVLPSFKPGVWPYKKINLGLDLQGGMHLVLEVDTDKAVDSTIERIYQDMRLQLKKAKIRHGRIEIIAGPKINLSITDAAMVEQFETLLGDEFRDLRIASKEQTDAGVAFSLDLPEKETEP